MLDEVNTHAKLIDPAIRETGYICGFVRWTATPDTSLCDTLLPNFLSVKIELPAAESITEGGV